MYDLELHMYTWERLRWKHGSQCVDGVYTRGLDGITGSDVADSLALCHPGSPHTDDAYKVPIIIKKDA